MDLENIVAVSEMPGLYTIVANRPNGLIVEHLDGGKRKFVSIRKYTFTPLQTVAIYTYDDSTPLEEVFQTMYDKRDEFPVPDPGDSSSVLMTYFKEIVDKYDEDKVKASDVKKVIKWFRFLDERGHITAESAPSSEEE